MVRYKVNQEWEPNPGMEVLEMLSWYPLHVEAKNRLRANDCHGYLFALTPTVEQAALIVLLMNKCARRDFGCENNN